MQFQCAGRVGSNRAIFISSTCTLGEASQLALMCQSELCLSKWEFSLRLTQVEPTRLTRLAGLETGASGAVGRVLAIAGRAESSSGEDGINSREEEEAAGEFKRLWGRRVGGASAKDPRAGPSDWSAKVDGSLPLEARKRRPVGLEPDAAALAKIIIKTESHLAGKPASKMHSSSLKK